MPPFEYVGRYFSSKAQFVSKSAELRDFKFRWAFEPIADEWLGEFQFTALAALKAKAPVGRHYDLLGTEKAGGAFRNSLYPTVFHRPGGVDLKVHSRVPYAKHILSGTAPHTIGKSSNIAAHRAGSRGPTGKMAGEASVLAFWWAKAGQAMFVPYVNHPGTRANTFNVVVRDAISPLARDTLITKIREHYTR